MFIRAVYRVEKMRWTLRAHNDAAGVCLVMMPGECVYVDDEIG